MEFVNQKMNYDLKITHEKTRCLPDTFCLDFIFIPYCIFYINGVRVKRL